MLDALNLFESQSWLLLTKSPLCWQKDWLIHHSFPWSLTSGGYTRACRVMFLEVMFYIPVNKHIWRLSNWTLEKSKRKLEVEIVPVSGETLLRQSWALGLNLESGVFILTSPGSALLLCVFIQQIHVFENKYTRWEAEQNCGISLFLPVQRSLWFWPVKNPGEEIHATCEWCYKKMAVSQPLPVIHPLLWFSYFLYIFHNSLGNWLSLVNSFLIKKPGL